MKNTRRTGKANRISEDKVFVNVHKYGNKYRNIPVALAEALEEGKIKPDDHILMASFGAGLTYGAGLIKWSNRVIPLTTSDAELPLARKPA